MNSNSLMTQCLTFWRTAWLSGGLVCLLFAAHGAAAQEEDPPLPKLDQMVLPSVQELLTGEPMDWVVIEEDDVIVVEPIFPRPQFLEARQREIEALERERIGLTGDALERWRVERDELNYIYVFIPEGGESPEYRLAIRRIKEIIYHEDLILRRMDQLIADGDLDTSLELLLRVQRRYPEWPGLAARHHALLMADVRARMQQRDYESALMVADELHRLEPTYPGLRETIGDAAGQLISAALAADDLKQAHYFLFRLDAAYPQHPTYVQYANQLSQRAQIDLDAALAARAAGRHDEAATLVEEAARVWPRLSNLSSTHSMLTQRYQRLRVGVVNLASDLNAYPPASRAELRERALTEIPLFETDRLDGNTVFYRTRFFDEWIPFDLGRRVKFQLRQVRQPWEFHPLLDSQTVAQEIIDRINPNHPKYDERLASYVDGVSVDSPIEFTLRFRRVPARLEPLFRWAVQAPDPSRSVDAPGLAFEFVAGTLDDGNEPAEEAAPLDPRRDPMPGRGGFVLTEATENQLRFVRDFPEMDGLREYHVAEVVEVRYPDHERAVQALLEGEVSLLPDVPDWIYRRLADSEAFNSAFFHVPYALPTTHILQFNPQSRPIRLRELRRALAYGLNREQILGETVLRDPTFEHGRLISGPFFTRSYANSVTVEPWPYDLSSAVALTLAAARQLDGQLPELKLLAPPDPVEQAAAAEMIRMWKRIGLTVTLVEPTADPSPDWDILYRTVQLTEPIIDLWPFVSQQSTARLGDLDHFPDWLKREFIKLDRMSDWTLAVRQTQSLHRQLTSEAMFIPLWEVDEFLIYRKTISGVPRVPVHCYDRIDRWSMSAFLPRWQPE